MANTRRTADVADALVAKGMEQDENHHHMFRLHLDHVTTLVTRISHGVREIDDYLIGLMGKQCALQGKEFLNLVDCPMSAEEWHALVAERCAGGRNPFIA